MDSWIKAVSYASFIVSMIIIEIFCENSTYHGHNVTYVAAVHYNKSSYHPAESSFSLNRPAWEFPSNISNPRVNSWSDIQSVYSYMNNSRIPVYSNIGGKSRGPPSNTTTTSPDVTDDELRNFAEDLLLRDENNAHRFITVNYQSKTTSRSPQDMSPDPLLHVTGNVHRMPTISKIKRLYDNYIPQVDEPEVVTNEELREEDDLLDAVLSTNIMEYTRNFLISKGLIGNDPQEFRKILKEIWFTLYPRGKKRNGSCGFEHVFLAEIKKGEVSGFHNWIYFNHQELNNTVNYFGYMKALEFGNKGAIIKHHFTFLGYDKPVGSLFIGISPEFEMALYSTCFLIRPNKVCPMKLDGKKFIIRVFTFDFRGKKLIGSAYPEI